MTINQHFKTFMQTLQDINTVDPSVPLVKLDTQWVQAKGGVADVTKGLKLFTTEATDGAKTRQKALDDEVQANTKYAADMIARYATLEEAQEQANDRRLDEEHDMMTKFRAIRDAGWAGVLADEAKARKEEEDLAKKEFEQTLARINTERETQEQAQRDFQRFQEQVSDKVGDVLFDFTKSLTDGSIKMKDIWKETLTTIKDTFLRTLTEMAAQALVKQILIPVGVTSGAGGGTADLFGLLKLFGGGGATGTTAVPGAAVQGPTPSGAPVGSTAAAVGTVAGAVGTGAIAGITVQGLAKAILDQSGAGSLSTNVLAGAAGGAVAGAVAGAPIFGVGAIAGAIVGGIIGAAVPLIQHLLGNVPDQPNYATAIQTAGARRPGGGPFLAGAARRGPFGFVGPTGAFAQERPDVPGPEFALAFVKLDEALASHLSRRQVEIAAAALQAQGRGLRISFEQFDNELADITKDRMQTILGGLAKDLGVRHAAGFTGRVFAGIGTEEEDIPALEDAFAKAATFLETLRALGDQRKPLTQAEQALHAVTEQFADLAAEARHYGVSLQVIDAAMKRQLTTFWESVAENLKMQQQNLLQAIGGTRQTIEEALMTPAVIFARRQAELEALQGEFAGAGPGKQVAMAPELLRRVQELFQLGASADVLGQDREALLRLQQDLLSFVDEIEQVAGQEAFNQQIAAAEAQVDLLGEIKRVNEQHLTEMNKTLHNIEKFLARGSEQFVGEFQTGGLVPQTGLARVHQGEYVLSPSQVRTLSSGAASAGPMTLNMAVTVNASGMDRRSLEQTGETIGKTAWRWIENAAERRRIPLKLDK